MINRILLTIFVLFLIFLLGWCSRQQLANESAGSGNEKASIAATATATPGAASMAGGMIEDAADKASAAATAIAEGAATAGSAAAAMMAKAGEAATAMAGEASGKGAESAGDANAATAEEPAPRPEDFAAASAASDGGDTSATTAEPASSGGDLASRVEATLTQAATGDDTASIVLEGVNFRSNSDELLPAARAILDVIIADLRSHAGVRVEIAGYTDNTGDPNYNVELSQRRARAVVDYLVAGGIDASRLSAKGYGAASPIADNSTAEGRHKNRRVEMHVLK